MKYFGFSPGEFIPCEITGKTAQDVHHIWARSIRKDLEFEISNLMALSREMHIKYGDKKQWRDYLQEIHDKYMERNRK